MEIQQPTKKSNTGLRGFFIFCLCAGGLSMCALLSDNKTSSPESSTVSTNKGSNSTTSNFSDGAADQAAMRDLRNTTWVKDVYVSPGHMNIGVIRGEKDWSAPMISSYVCGIIRKHGSKLARVRFVDIQAVANQGQSPRQAEIYISDCQ